MDKVINLGMPHIGEQIFESLDTLGLINCMEVSETWRELAENVLIKRLKGKIYVSIYKACRRKHGKTRLAQALLKDLDNTVLFQIALVSETWKVLAENALTKRWKGNIYEACKNGETKIVQLLLERCTSEESGLNITDRNGYTPFIMACYYGHKDLVKLLLDHPERIELNAKVPYGWTGFMFACQKGHKEVVKLLLNHSERIELNVRDNEDGRTPFMLACINGHKEVVQFLLERCNSEESGLNTKDESGDTPFSWSCRNGHKDVVKLLLNHSERIELNARNNYGWTAFIEACYYGHKDVIQLLLDNFERIELNATDKCGFTGLMIAHRRGHQDIVQMIKSRMTGVTFLPCFWAFICSLFLITVAAAIGLFSDEFYVKLHKLVCSY